MFDNLALFFKQPDQAVNGLRSCIVGAALQVVDQNFLAVRTDFEARIISSLNYETKGKTLSFEREFHF